MCSGVWSAQRRALRNLQRLVGCERLRATVYFGPVVFYQDAAAVSLYTLSLHDALPICPDAGGPARSSAAAWRRRADHCARRRSRWRDRKSTRLNSSHVEISYAVFCLKKKTRRPPPVPLHVFWSLVCAAQGSTEPSATRRV